MFTRGSSNRLFYNHVERAGEGRLRVQALVTIPSALRLGPASSRWLLVALHQGHQQLLTELSEHHKTAPRFFTPPAHSLPTSSAELGDIIVEIRANTAATRLQMSTVVQKKFGPIAAILLEAIGDPDVRAHWLAEQAAIECRNCGTRVEMPDDKTYDRIVREIVDEPPTSDDVLADIKREVPVGTSQDVIRLAVARR